MRERRKDQSHDESDHTTDEKAPIGRSTITQRHVGNADPIQRAVLDAAWASRSIQLHGDEHTGLGDDGVRQAAAHGISGGDRQLPYLDVIQRSFGDQHDISGVRAHFGTEASEANRALGANAFATGNDIAFANESPSLHLAAHEAAHVVQQRAGVHLSSAVGRAGDSYEQHADAVADRVVRGESAADLFGAGPLAASAASAVQRDENPAAVATPTTPLTIKADYREVPGAAKNAFAQRGADNAMHLDLSIDATEPVTRPVVRKARGAITGTGARVVETAQVPVDGDSGFGNGQISAHIFHADKRGKYTGAISLPKGKADATAKLTAQESIQASLSLHGDIEQAEREAAAALAEDGVDGAKVKISMATETKSRDLGEVTYHYRARNKPVVLMNIIPIETDRRKSKTASVKETTNKNGFTGETKQEGYRETKDTSYSNDANQSETGGYANTAGSTETIEKSKRAIEMLTGFVKSVEKGRETVNSFLVDKMLTDHTNKTVSTTYLLDTDVGSSHEDGSSNSKKESGERSNMAAKLAGLIGAVKDYQTPMEKVPGIGWVAKKIKGWQLGFAEKALSPFVEGKIKYETETSSNNKDANDDRTKTKDGSDTTTETGNGSDTQTRVLIEKFNTDTEKTWSQFKLKVETMKEDYKRVVTSGSMGGSFSKSNQNDSGNKHDETIIETGGTNTSEYGDSSATTTITVEGESSTLSVKPGVTAAVVAGDGEVSEAPLVGAPKAPVVEKIVGKR